MKRHLFGLGPIRAAAVCVALLATTATRSSAAPSVWARARQPDLEQQLTAMRRSEELLLKHRRLLQMQRGEIFPGMGSVYLQEARKTLEAAGAEMSSDPMMRYRLAEVLQALAEVFYRIDDIALAQKQSARAAKLLESALRAPSLPATLRATGWADLAVCYAHLGRHQEEIKAYGEALNLETRSSARATLFANRAEGYMALGDISSAVEGYRTSIAMLLPIEMFRTGVTTLWGLAVALDRSGDLESAFRSINLAREYDPTDVLINGPGWFYVPLYDEAWYSALGHWARARQFTLPSSRAQAYANAIADWEEYIARAPSTDRWLELAKSRLEMCERERDTITQRSAPAAPTTPPAPKRPVAPARR